MFDKDTMMTETPLNFLELTRKNFHFSIGNISIKILGEFFSKTFGRQTVLIEVTAPYLLV